MTYIPDFRGEENERHLSENDKNFLEGYRFAISVMMTVFDNLDMYEVSDGEEAVLADFKECLADYMNRNEIEVVCSLFDNADYIPEDVELVDHNPKLYDIKRG